MRKFILIKVDKFAYILYIVLMFANELYIDLLTIWILYKYKKFT